MEKPDTIELLACIAPDGSLAFAWDTDSAREITQGWRDRQDSEKAEQHKAAHTYGGFVQIKMLKSDWDAMNLSCIHFEAADEEGRE